MIRLGVVSFLNSRPLIDGLTARSDVQCRFDVPAALSTRLAQGEFDAALVPLIDVLRSRGVLRVVSDACIGSDGETMTVRVFSKRPPHHVRTLMVDGDSHTSVALARILWRQLFEIDLDLRPLDARRTDPAQHDAVLLIGDKVVAPDRGQFGYEVDLGGAWRQHTGLPFVFAVWAQPASSSVPGSALADILSAARDRGVARAGALAREQGPGLGWPVELAERYLTRCLSFTLDARAVAGAQRYAECCAALDLVPPDAAIAWPANLQPQAAGSVR